MKSCRSIFAVLMCCLAVLRAAGQVPSPPGQPPREPQRLPANVSPARPIDAAPPAAFPVAADPAKLQPGGVAPATFRAPTEIPAPSSEPSRDEPLRLTPRGQNTARSTTQAAAGQRSSSASRSLVSVGASLAVVLGLFLLGAWVLRRSMPAGAPRLPSEVVEVLGRTPLGTRQQAHLLRVGNKLVLVSLTPGGAETITEVTDPVEVDRLAGLCRATQTNSSSDSFRSVLQQFAKQRAPGGFLGLGRTPVTTTASQQPQAVEEDADV